MLNDPLNLLHNVELEVRGPEGELKDRREEHNLVVTAGKNAIATLLKEGTTRPKYIAVGTGTEEPAAGDTKLKTEVKRGEVTVTVESAVVKLEKEFAAGEATGAITEEGILSASSEGTLYAHTKFSAVNIGAEDTLKVTHKITVG